MTRELTICVPICAVLLASACPASTTNAPVDAGVAGSGGGACVSNAGGPCSGMGVNPCVCAGGLACLPNTGLPVGQAGGICLASDAGVGPINIGSGGSPSTCVSPVGGPCGGFVANPCICAEGLSCAQPVIGTVVGSGVGGVGICHLP